jgi:DNA helicase-2/ATP-dependent DNA helicase PcrA
LILAGAGSGKTTVLVSRTGRLISEKLTHPERICVLTFTNKAAQELKHRVARKLGNAAAEVWAGTFHGFGLQFLKTFSDQAGLPRRFGVIDQQDSIAVLKELMKDHKSFEKEAFAAEKVMQKISLLRESGRESALGESPESTMAIVLAPKYLKRLRNLGVVDFEELLLRPLRLMKEDDGIRKRMQGMFDFVMVDEFQDTNVTQMQMIDELTAVHRNIAVVGDDDQSIYGWRGAQIRNILDFPKRYKNCAVIRLERNYRSTARILNMANAIIAANKDRHTKVLKPSSGEEGDLPELFTYPNEEAEVDAIVNELQTFQKRGYQWKDIAVLYRSNAQGGLMEGGLRRTGIPYRITGGTALFDRKEAKDVLAFIRCSIYPNEIALRRVINLPSRGVGDKTIESIEEYKTAKPTEFHVKARMWSQAHPQEKSAESILGFFAFLEELKHNLVHSTSDAEEVLQSELDRLGYRKYVYDSFKDPKAAESRWLVVVILGRILSGMFNKHGRTMKTLDLFIDSMELRDREENEDEQGQNQVQMMTLHACKGLEFPLVFLLGLEEDLLPHAKLGQDVDEERRLFYVGVTRAKKHLVLTRVRERKRYGKVQLITPSRFLMELDKSLYADLGAGRAISQDERKNLMADLFKKLDKKIAEREPM